MQNKHGPVETQIHTFDKIYIIRHSLAGGNGDIIIGRA